MKSHRFADRVLCADLNDKFLIHLNEYENTTNVRLEGDFTEIGSDSRYTKLFSIVVNLESLVNIRMNYLNNQMSLISLETTSKNDKTIDLNSFRTCRSCL